MKAKICRHCKETKPEDQFVNWKLIDSKVCKKCSQEKRKLWLKERKSKIIVKTDGTKICRECGLEKPSTKFLKDISYPDGRTVRCSACVKKAKKTSSTWFINRRVGYANFRHSDKLTTKEVLEKFAYQQQECIYCGTQLTESNLALDHILPLSRGGSNTIDNINCLCGSCNRLKFTMTHEEFTEFLKVYLANVNRRLDLKL